MPKFLLQFPHKHSTFHLAELASVASLFGIETGPLHKDPSVPFMEVEMKSESPVRKLLSRCLLLKNAMELWSSAKTYAELHENLRMESARYQEYFAKNRTWSVVVNAFGKKISPEYKLKRIEALDCLPFEGPVQLKNPSTSFMLYEYYGVNPNNAPAEPIEIFFGRLLGTGQAGLAEKFNLPDRCYIGNTSMDPYLSFIMANLGRVTEGSLVFDPFVGTGSLLVAASRFGAYSIGSEINYNLVHGLGRSSRANEKFRKSGENVRNNFVQYGLEDKYVGSLLADSSKPDMWRNGHIFDAIITDPPYGLREKTIRLGVKKSSTATDNGSAHFPEKTKYLLTDVFLDLLNFAAVHLVINGRLVYWFPVPLDEYSEDILPQHPCLSLIANCDQQLSNTHSRHCIVMQKIRNPQEDDDRAFIQRNIYADVSYRDRVCAADGKKPELFTSDPPH